MQVVLTTRSKSFIRYLCLRTNYFHS